MHEVKLQAFLVLDHIGSVPLGNDLEFPAVRCADILQAHPVIAVASHGTDIQAAVCGMHRAQIAVTALIGTDLTELLCPAVLPVLLHQPGSNCGLPVLQPEVLAAVAGTEPVNAAHGQGFVRRLKIPHQRRVALI